MPELINQRTKEHLSTKNIVVLYHGNCSDGFGGAWAAWKKFGSRADYIAVNDHNNSPQGLEGKEIYMIDFTYNMASLKKIMESNKKVTAIDHHVSTQTETEMTQNYSYALNDSGSVLAWKYFHPLKPVPKLLLVIEDFDLWRFKIPHSKEIFAYLDLFDFNFKLWSKLIKQTEEPADFKKMITTGKFLLQYEEKLVQRIVADKAIPVQFEGYRVLAVNSSVFHSQIGSALVKLNPPIGIIWRQTKDGVTVSLRGDGTVDLSEIAEHYDGGGHKSSAAFIVKTLADLPFKPL